MDMDEPQTMTEAVMQDSFKHAHMKNIALCDANRELLEASAQAVDDLGLRVGRHEIDQIRNSLRAAIQKVKELS